MQTTYTASAGDIVSFFWKVSSESGDDLKFYIDGSPQNSIDGEEDWQKKSYALSAGSRTLKWVYVKDDEDYEGDDCGWVDGLYVGPSSGSLPADPEGPGAYAEAVDSSLKFTSSGDDNGTCLTLPDEPELREDFPPPKDNHGYGRYPLARAFPADLAQVNYTSQALTACTSDSTGSRRGEYSWAT